MKEGPFLAWIISAAKATGWSVWHVPAPMKRVRGEWVGAKEAAGLPDLLMIHDDPPRLILAEVKGDGGKLSDEQRDFLQAAKKVAENSIEEDLSFPESRTRTIGVFVFQPGQEAAIEQMLRSRAVE